MVYRESLWQGKDINRNHPLSLLFSPPAHIDVCIRIHEYMCRFLILFSHYLFHDDEFMNQRNKSLSSWLTQLFILYTTAVNLRFHFPGVSSRPLRRPAELRGVSRLLRALLR